MVFFFSSLSYQLLLSLTISSVLLFIRMFGWFAYILNKCFCTPEKYILNSLLPWADIIPEMKQLKMNIFSNTLLQYSRACTKVTLLFSSQCCRIERIHHTWKTKRLIHSSTEDLKNSTKVTVYFRTAKFIFYNPRRNMFFFTGYYQQYLSQDIIKRSEQATTITFVKEYVGMGLPTREMLIPGGAARTRRIWTKQFSTLSTSSTKCWVFCWRAFCSKAVTYLEHYNRRQDLWAFWPCFWHLYPQNFLPLPNLFSSPNPISLPVLTSRVFLRSLTIVNRWRSITFQQSSHRCLVWLQLTVSVTHC